MIRITLCIFLTISTLATFGQVRAIPASIQVNSNSKLIMQAYARGTQEYICQHDLKDTSKYVWIFIEPRALLYADSTYHNIIGKHYFDASKNPTWENIDGSKVTAIKLQQVNAPDNLSIPWLLLKVTLTQATGILKSAQFVQRVFTKGGKAPAKAKGDQLGKTIDVPYTAQYLFYTEK